EPSRLQLITRGTLIGRAKKSVAVEARRQYQPTGRATIQAADQLAETKYGNSRRHRVDGHAIAQVRPDHVGNAVTSNVADKSHRVALRISPSPDWPAAHRAVASGRMPRRTLAPGVRSSDRIQHEAAELWDCLNERRTASGCR